MARIGISLASLRRFERFFDPRIAAKRAAKNRGKRFAAGDASQKIGVLQLPPDGDPGDDRDNDRRRTREQRLEVMDEAPEAHQPTVGRLSADRFHVPPCLSGCGQ